MLFPFSNDHECCNNTCSTHVRNITGIFDGCHEDENNYGITKYMYILQMPNTAVTAPLSNNRLHTYLNTVTLLSHWNIPQIHGNTCNKVATTRYQFVWGSFKLHYHVMLHVPMKDKYFLLRTVLPIPFSDGLHCSSFFLTEHPTSMLHGTYTTYINLSWGASGYPSYKTANEGITNYITLHTICMHNYVCIIVTHVQVPCGLAGSVNSCI